MKILRILIFNLLLSFPFLFAQAAAIENPIKGADSIEQLIAKIIDAAVIILMPLVVLFIVYSGFMFLIARGNTEALNKAKTNFIWVIVGVSVLLGAKVISAILKSTTEKIISY